MQKIHDITIVGGGLIGCALALALRDSAWRVALIEAHTFSPALSQIPGDMRSLALAYASQQILENMGIWQEIARHAAAINRIHISQQGRFGTTLLDAQKLGLSSFGQVVPLPILFQALQANLAGLTNLALYQPAKVSALEQIADGWQLALNENQSLKTTLVIAADGDRSWIRQVLALPTEMTDYEQTALATNVGISLPHHGTAYERFTPNGSIALLPLPNQRAGLVCITDKTHAEQWQSCSDQEFLQHAQQALGYRLGKLTNLGKRQSHPLRAIRAQQQYLAGLLLLGNAAHTLHPIAAQGFNLGLRDVAALAKLLMETKDLQDKTLFSRYLENRQRDQDNTLRFTNDLIKLFKPKLFPLPTLRSLGLQLFDLVPPAKFAFCLRRMGVA